MQYGKALKSSHRNCDVSIQHADQEWQVVSQRVDKWHHRWLAAWNGAQGRDRTTDTVIFSHVLYQLSYLGAEHRRAGGVGQGARL
jgi:hypothetical protein